MPAKDESEEIEKRRPKWRFDLDQVYPGQEFWIHTDCFSEVGT